SAEGGAGEVGPAEGGLDEVGQAEVGLAEVGLAEVGLEKVGLAEVGLAEVGLEKVGLAEVRPDVFVLLPPRLPHRDTLLPDLEMLRVRHRARLPLYSSHF